MFYYYAYGLGISSELEFPELIKKKFDTDVIIRFGEYNLNSKDKFVERYLKNAIKIRFISKMAYFYWKNIQVFCIQDGKEIIINPRTGLEEDFLRLLILGSGMSILLHQRGRLVLHASAVNMNGFAIGFLGFSGSGKSTTSLALHKKGYNLISDDILSIKVNMDDFPILFPSFPRIKLWPDVLMNMPDIPESIPKSHLNTDKRSYCVSDNFSNIPIPLRAIYLVERSNKTTISKLNPQMSLMELIKSSYCYPIFNNMEISENLKQCAIISNKVPVKTLKVKRSFENLHEIVKAIENDIFEF